MWLLCGCFDKGGNASIPLFSVCICSVLQMLNYHLMCDTKIHNLILHQAMQGTVYNKQRSVWFSWINFIKHLDQNLVHSNLSTKLESKYKPWNHTSQRNGLQRSLSPIFCLCRGSAIAWIFVFNSSFACILCFCYHFGFGCPNSLHSLTLSFTVWFSLISGAFGGTCEHRT